MSWVLASKGHMAITAALSVAVVAAGSAVAVVATSTTSAAQPPTSVMAAAGNGPGLNATANGEATISWKAPTSGPAITGYLVEVSPGYTDVKPAPSLGANSGGTQQYTLPPTTRSYTFSGLYQDCHQRYAMSVTALSASGPSQAVLTNSFRPSGYVIPNSDPPYVVVLVDGIDSVQPGFQMDPYTPMLGTLQSYCPESWDPTLNQGNGDETEANFAKSYGLAKNTQPTGPWSFFHKWNHGETDANGNPTSGQSGGPNLRVASEPKLLTGNGSNMFTHSFMLDDIAARGSIILPYSYPSHNSCASNPVSAYVNTSGTFFYPSYDKPDSDPFPLLNDWFSHPTCRNTMTTDARALSVELGSIHAYWPSSKLVVMGHSQGGLVIATAWKNNFFNVSVPGIQAFSLDAPINGVCPDDISVFGQQACFGPPSYPEYTKRGTFDEGSGGYLGTDAADGYNMHFVGTYGDSPAVPVPIGGILQVVAPEAAVPLDVTSVLQAVAGGSNLFEQLNNSVYLHSYGIGAPTLEAQMPFWYSTTDPPGPGTVTATDVEQNCTVKADKNGGWPQVDSHCPAPKEADKISPCPVDFFSVPQWIQDTGHFVVKYCPGVVDYFNSTLGLSPLPQTGTGVTGWACTRTTFAQLMSNPIESDVSPAGTRPKCLDGYAEMDFKIPNETVAPFFFSFTAGKWVVIKGGGEIPPAPACRVIPHQVMSAWGYNCNGSSSNSGGSVAPGHGSPAAAIAGLYESELNNDWSASTGACTSRATKPRSRSRGRSQRRTVPPSRTQIQLRECRTPGRTSRRSSVMW